MSTISRWIREVISLAYKREGSATSLGVRVKAHEVRAWASTLAFEHSWCMKDVLDAAYWASESTFINYYLRDTSAQRLDGTWGISSLVAAGQKVVLK